MNRRFAKSFFHVLFCSLFMLGLPVSAQIVPWSNYSGSDWNTHYYSTHTPARPSTIIQNSTVEADAPVQYGMISGDLMGDGQTWLAYVCKDPLALVIVNPLTQESITIPLEENTKDIILSMDQTGIHQLLEYDGEPGPEILCEVGSYKTPPLFEIVSPRKQRVIKSFYGAGGRDVHGDGLWDGQEVDPKLFQAPSGKWKLFSHSSTERTDKVSRGLNVYDAATGEFESRLSVAGSGGWNAMAILPDLGPFFFIGLITPDNGYSAVFDGKLVFDDEAFNMGLTYNETKHGFDLHWYRSRGRYLSGSFMINRDAQGRYLGCASDYVIRPFDAESPGRLHFYDLISGEIINTVTMEPGISFNNFWAPEGTGEFFATIQEEPGIVKIDIVNGLTEWVTFSDPAAQIGLLGVTDMDGDGQYDVLASLASKGKYYILIYDKNLKEKFRFEIPTTINSHVAFADADQDGYPEMYYPDKRTNKRILSIEFATPTQSNVGGFSVYK